MQFGFGTVVFDDPAAPQRGWASIAGDSAFRIESTAALATDVLWLTNVAYDEFFKTSDLGLNPWLRHDGFLPIRMKDMLTEWGNDPAQTDRDEMAMFTSELWHRIMEITKRLLKRNAPKTPEEHLFTGRTLKEDLRFLLPPAEYPTDEAGSILRSGVGYNQFTKVSQKGPKGSKIVALRRPRLDHAIDLLTTPTPVGPFNLFQGLELPSTRELVNSKRPVFANIAIRRYADPRFSAIYSFGGGLNNGKRIPRTWVPHPEFAILAATSTLEVQNAFIGKSYEDMATGILEFIRAFLESGDSAVSWSCGVIADTLWRSATLGMERADSFIPLNEQPKTSWRGAWVTAQDKVSTFMLAMKLARQGYTVLSYGMGAIYCAVPPERTRDIIIDAWKIGLLPAMRDIEAPVSKEKLTADPWGGEPRSRIQAHLLMTKQQNISWELDNLPLTAGSEKQAILRTAQEALR